MRKLLTLAAIAVPLAGCVAPPPIVYAPPPAGPLAAARPTTGTVAPGATATTLEPDGTPVQVPLVAVPGPNKTPAQFAADDVACRNAPAPRARNSTGTYTPLTQGGQPVPDSPGVGYLRCMAARNNTVEPIAEPEPPVVYGYYPAYPVYAGYDYGFPVFYDNFFGLGFYPGFGGFYHRGFYGGGFYGRGFYGRGFYGGGYGRFGGPGFGRGGFGGFRDGGFRGGGFGGGGFGGGGFRGGGGGGFRGR